MAKPRSRSVDFIVYLAVRGLVCLLQGIPEALARQLARGLAWLAYTVDKRHRLVAIDNLHHAFPELRDDPARTDRLVRAVYRHFCTLLVEIVLLPRKLHLSNYRRHICWVGGDKIVPSMLGDRPLLIVTG